MYTSYEWRPTARWIDNVWSFTMLQEDEEAAPLKSTLTIVHT